MVMPEIWSSTGKAIFTRCQGERGLTRHQSRNIHEREGDFEGAARRCVEIKVSKIATKLKKGR